MNTQSTKKYFLTYSRYFKNHLNIKKIVLALNFYWNGLYKLKVHEVNENKL